MSKPGNLLQTFGIILLLLFLIGFINYTTNLIFGNAKLKTTKLTNLIYDKDIKPNTTHICPLQENTYQKKYEFSNCFNKTMLYWYIPWQHYSTWKTFQENNAEKRRIKELEKLQVTVLIEEEEISEKKVEAEVDESIRSKGNLTNQKVKEKPSKMVYTILASLLVLSSAVACLEVFRDKIKGHGNAEKKAQDRRCSLADFTINRHLRKESQQANMQHIQRQASFDHPAKVTQNLIHQGSLDRAISKLNSEVKPPPLLRRSSVPAHLAATTNNASGSNTNNFTQQIDKDKPRSRNLSSSIFQSMGNKKTSCDLSGDDSSPDMRRKSRHFIRRH